MQTTSNLDLEPTPLASAWRYRWLVLVLAVLFGVVGRWYADSSETWTASATLGVQDPRSSIVFDQALRLDPRRYVADQIEIIKSRVVAREAISQLDAAGSNVNIGISEILTNLSVSAAEETDLISVSYAHPEPATAVAVANAVSDAYQATSRSTAEATFADALAELDESIAQRQTELDEIGMELASLRGSEASRIELEASLEEALAEVLDFQFPVAVGDPEQLAAATAAATAELAELRQRVELLQVALAGFTDDENISELETQQADLRVRLSALELRRDQLAVDAELAGNGVIFYSPAETADKSGSTILIILGVVGGALLGMAIAQSLARRRRDFHGRREPRDVLKTELISDIPLFEDERLKTSLPSTEAPQSAAAESFRFVATGVKLRQQTDEGTAAFRSVVVASATLADGKTTVTANTAFAAARGGSKVAIIDADFVNPALTELLLPGGEKAPGLTDLARDEAKLSAVSHEVVGAGGETITLLTRGRFAAEMPDFFAAAGAEQLVRKLEERYDLVLIDAPPVLRLAQSGSVVRLAQRVLVVVAHKSNIALAEDLERYLSVVGVPVLGYVYNFAPLRTELLARSGSSGSARPDDQ